MPGWGPGRHGAGRHRGRPRRIRRFVEPAILLLLRRGPNHGYGLLAGLDALGLESYPADISAIYRVLYALEGQDMVTSTVDAAVSAGPPRRVYRLTAQGEAYLNEWVADLRETQRVLGRFLSAYESEDIASGQETDAEDS